MVTQQPELPLFLIPLASRQTGPNTYEITTAKPKAQAPEIRVSEAARLLKSSEQTVLNLIHAGHIKGRKATPGRTCRVWVDWLSLMQWRQKGEL